MITSGVPLRVPSVVASSFFWTSQGFSYEITPWVPSECHPGFLPGFPQKFFPGMLQKFPAEILSGYPSEFLQWSLPFFLLDSSSIPCNIPPRVPWGFFQQLFSIYIKEILPGFLKNLLRGSSRNFRYPDLSSKYFWDSFRDIIRIFFKKFLLDYSRIFFWDSLGSFFRELLPETFKKCFQYF